MPRDNWDIDNRDLRYIFNGFVYGGLISDDNINFVSYMLEGINDRENYIKIFIGEKRNIQKVSGLKPEGYFEEKFGIFGFCQRDGTEKKDQAAAGLLYAVKERLGCRCSV